MNEVKCSIVDEKCNNNIKSDLSISPCQSCQCEKGVSDVAELLNGKSCKNRRGRLNEGWSSSEHSQDCGYSSENNNGCCDTASVSSSLPSSPEGSEVACSEGFCNHEGECHILDRPHSEMDYDTQPAGPTSNNGGKLTLEQMLDLCSSDEDGEESYIPAEEVLEFKSKTSHLTEKRQELRQTWKTRFAQLCIGVPITQPRLFAQTKFVTD